MRTAMIAALCLPAFAGAQVFKCTANGTTVYQAQPCDNGKRLEIQMPKPPDNERAARICDTVLQMRLKDPDSAKMITPWLYIGAQKHAGKATIAWGRSVNAKNEFGGYTGERPVICHLDSDYGLVGMTGGGP